MNVLVLGGSYFIGRTLTDRLLADGHTVALLNRGSHPVPGVEQLFADRNDLAAMVDALGQRSFDWVLDVSCYTPEQARIATEAMGGRCAKWMYLSTAAVYPGRKTRPFTEDEVGPGREWEDYGRNKLQAERELESTDSLKGTPLVVVRPPYVYGPRNTLPREWWLWARMLQGRPTWIPRDGSTLIPFVHVADLADAMVVAMSRATQPVNIFNVAALETPSIREYVALVGEVAGITPDVREVDYVRLGIEVREFFPFRDFENLVDTTRIERALGWRARYTLRDGLTQTLSTLDREALRSADTYVPLDGRMQIG